MLLVIDSAGTTAAIALGDAGQVNYSAQLNSGRTHSEQLLPLAVHAMKTLGLTFSDLKGIGVTAGPGSFTGLRIGMATAKGLAQGANLPFVSVPTLDVLAENGRGFSGLVCPLLNARRNEVYTALYREGEEGMGMERLMPYQAIGLEELLATIPSEEKVFFTGDGLDAYHETIVSQLKGRAVPALGTWRYVEGSALLRLAASRLEKHGGDDLYHSQPIYLRQSEAVLRWEAAHPGASLED